MFPKFILWGVFLTLLTACSSNGTIGTALPRDGSAQYFPLAIDNQWVYTGLDEEGPRKEVDLKVRDSVNEFETTGFSFSSTTPVEDQTTTINMLVNGTIHNISSRIIYNGNLILNLPVLEDSLKIPLKNIVLLKQNNEAFQKVSEFQDSISSTHSYSDGEIPLYFKYTVESYSDAIPKNFVIDGISHDHVLTGEITVDLSIELRPYGYSPVLILPRQTVLKIQNHFIEDLGIGLIEENQNFQFQHLGILHVKNDTMIENTYKQKVISYYLKD